MVLIWNVEKVSETVRVVSASSSYFTFKTCQECDKK